MPRTEGCFCCGGGRVLKLRKVQVEGIAFGVKIAIGTDHAGYAYKEEIKRHLIGRGHEVADFGTFSESAVDYPIFVRPAAEAVARGECARGIVLGGSGNGEAITANKVKGVRCALCWTEQTAIWCRQHNDANVLALGARTINIELALRIVDIFLETQFEGGRHRRRVEMIEGGSYSPAGSP